MKTTINLLKYTYGLVPIIAGLDKFTNLLTEWSQYLTPGMENLIPMEPASFMMIVGVIEIVAGVLVLVIPRIGAAVVASWLLTIALTLLLSWQYVDIAVRDLVMAIGAFSLSRLTSEK